MYTGSALVDAPLDSFGFIYCITDLDDGRRYIGKKQFWSLRTKRVKGRKNRKHYRIESDWKKYLSSSEEVQMRIAERGEERFSFEIVRLCETKGDLTFGEVEEQIKRDVLTARLPSGEFAYLNGNVMNRFFRRK